MPKTYVIGDLHGCIDEARDMLSKLSVTSSDRVIFTGDIVDRGNSSVKCVELAMKHECVLGNHEDRHLFYRDNPNELVLSPNHVETIRQLQPKHYDYLRSLPLYIQIPEHNLVVVHAGLFPNRPIENQSRRHLLHAQMLRPFNDNLQLDETTKWPSRVSGEPEWRFWTNFWSGSERVVFGHSVMDRPFLTDRFAGVDGGCCWNRELWALDVDAWKIVTVPARNKREDAKRTKKYVIDEETGVSTF